MPRQRVPMAAVGLALVVTACGGGGGEEDRAADEAHEHDNGHAQVVDADSTGERCDVGVNTAEFNQTTTLVERPHQHDAGSGIDFTLEEWANAFTDPDKGLPPGMVAATLQNDPDRAENILRGDHTHTLGPNEWAPLTEPGDCEKLADQLQQARDAAMQYPTVADALAAGFTPASFYAPGGGAHYSRGVADRDATFDPAEPDALMYDGHRPEDHIVGVMYFVFGNDGQLEEPGFVGQSDVWHGHDQACVSAQGITLPHFQCRRGQGTFMDRSNGFMAHAWVVPGCESDWGVFAEVNPRLPILLGRDNGFDPEAGDMAPMPFESGCDSGKVVTDPLDVDQSGTGPEIR